ncbi:MAG: hypothetical protein KIT45_01340 [Fimbriimonadia bacterium]|nr:hypothetical protein [Fimbriimonadia bacterium]
MDSHLKLTERERNVLRLFAEGKNESSVADELGLTGETLEETSLNVLHKLFAGSLMNTLQDEEVAEVESELVSA